MGFLASIVILIAASKTAKIIQKRMNFLFSYNEIICFNYSTTVSTIQLTFFPPYIKLAPDKASNKNRTNGNVSKNLI